MKKCSVCGKMPKSGNKVSHSNRKTKRMWFPNLQKIRVLIEGKVKKVYVCTKCMKAGKITKAPLKRKATSPA